MRVLEFLAKQIIVCKRNEQWD